MPQIRWHVRPRGDRVDLRGEVPTHGPFVAVLSLFSYLAANMAELSPSDMPQHPSLIKSVDADFSKRITTRSGG